MSLTIFFLFFRRQKFMKNKSGGQKNSMVFLHFIKKELKSGYGITQSTDNLGPSETENTNEQEDSTKKGRDRNVIPACAFGESEGSTIGTPAESRDFTSDESSEAEGSIIGTPVESSDFASDESSEGEGSIIGTPVESSDFASDESSEGEGSIIGTPAESSDFARDESSEGEGSVIGTPAESSDFTRSNDLDPRKKTKHLWVQCENCEKLNYKEILKSKIYICEYCDHHLKMSSSERIELSIDPGTWDPMDEDLVSLDPYEEQRIQNKIDQIINKLETLIFTKFLFIQTKDPIEQKKRIQKQIDQINRIWLLTFESDELDSGVVELDSDELDSDELDSDELDSGVVELDSDELDLEVERIHDQINTLLLTETKKKDPIEQREIILKIFSKIKTGLTERLMEGLMEAMPEEVSQLDLEGVEVDWNELDSDEDDWVRKHLVELDSDELDSDELDSEAVELDSDELDSEAVELDSDELDSDELDSEAVELDSDELDSDELDSDGLDSEAVELDSGGLDSDGLDSDGLDSEAVELDSDELEPYGDYIDSYQTKTGLTEAVQTGVGQLNGIPVAIGVMDCQFIAGSMGSVVGEKITRLIEYATNQCLPLIIVCASGGARMQEGSSSLMQMAKISSALYAYKYQAKEKLVYVTILTSPTTGGVTASFAMLGDLIIAEPNAYIAFAGKRVIEELLKVEVPEGSQETENLFEKGLVDLIVPRNLLKSVVTDFLQFHGFVPVKSN
uniref:Acetyl-coenzyme A carboxylase carboxyl transferase subunit beta, chloroplastic n=1 Tax=Plantago lagopus TaxID=185001 RepID=A0A411LBT3_9LAMI|nr:acetyl-CoA carboxylase carboxyltransferase beta subunit [Plantago lagopus]QBE89779.1 acetyl-CoA carboxylase carboxyltransferase beta subunit [Plantago lagopus]